MEMDKFGKKVAAILDEAPLEKRIEDRLAQARSIALSKAKQTNFIEVNVDSQGVLNSKSKIGEFHDQFKWFIWFSVGLMLVAFQQIYLQNNEEYEPVQYLSNDYLQYRDKLTIDQDKFSAWKENINNLIDKDDDDIDNDKSN